MRIKFIGRVGAATLIYPSQHLFCYYPHFALILIFPYPIFVLFIHTYLPDPSPVHPFIVLPNHGVTHYPYLIPIYRYRIYLQLCNLRLHASVHAHPLSHLRHLIRTPARRHFWSHDSLKYFVPYLQSLTHSHVTWRKWHNNCWAPHSRHTTIYHLKSNSRFSPSILSQPLQPIFTVISLPSAESFTSAD